MKGQNLSKDVKHLSTKDVGLLFDNGPLDNPWRDWARHVCHGMTCLSSEEGGGAGGLQPPNNLLRFVDFEGKTAVKAKVVGMKIGTQLIRHSRKLPESIKNGISFDVIQLQNFNFFLEILPSVALLCFFQWQIVQKWGVFQRSRGRGHEKFSRGQAPGPPFFLAPPFSSPNMNFAPTGLRSDLLP